jgi:hypothetical protein
MVGKAPIQQLRHPATAGISRVRRVFCGAEDQALSLTMVELIISSCSGQFY